MRASKRSTATPRAAARDDCCTASVSRAIRKASRCAASPAAGACASISAAPSCAAPIYCCSTSPPTTSTSTCVTRSIWRCKSSSARWCWSRTTAIYCARCATVSCWSPMAAPWRSTVISTTTVAGSCSATSSARATMSVPPPTTAPKRGVEHWEKAVTALETKKSALEQQLAAPAIYEAPQKEQLRMLLNEQIRIVQELASAEERWLGASEALEQAERDT